MKTNQKKEKEKSLLVWADIFWKLGSDCKFYPFGRATFHL